VLPGKNAFITSFAKTQPTEPKMNDIYDNFGLPTLPSAEDRLQIDAFFGPLNYPDNNRDAYFRAGFRPDPHREPTGKAPQGHRQLSQLRKRWAASRRSKRFLQSLPNPQPEER